MPHWEYRVDLRGVFHSDAPFPQRRDAIVARLRDSQWFQRTPPPSQLHTALNYLAAADTTADFNYWWNQLYYLADDDRVWIATR